MNINLHLTDISHWTGKDTSPPSYDDLQTLRDNGITRLESAGMRADILEVIQSDEYHNKSTNHEIRCSLVVPTQSHLIIPKNCADISVQLAVTESFSGHHFKQSVRKQLDDIADVCKLARATDTAVRVYIHCAFGCPYEGNVSAQSVSGFIAKLLRAGCNEFFLVDNTGSATAGHTSGLIHVMSHQIPKSRVGFLFANISPGSKENVESALALGVNRFCCSVPPCSPLPLSDEFHAAEIAIFQSLRNSQ